jgi:hypothetical protein
MMTTLRNVAAGCASSSAGNNESTIVHAVEASPRQASGIIVRRPPGSRNVPSGSGCRCSRIADANRKRYGMKYVITAVGVEKLVVLPRLLEPASSRGAALPSLSAAMRWLASVTVSAG